ncbi:MAG TPA: hypothetical protein VK254_00320 [Candidatus Bathyarchaeia archaeon]|nr:hypothetical protein [Candidatus Bathyarchaeia archaeon]
MTCLEKEENRTRGAEKSWGEISGRLLVSLAAFAGGHIQNIVERQKMRAVRSLVSYSLLFLAGLFILNGVALYLDELLKIRIWAGFLLVGLALVIIGLILPKSKTNY